MKLTLETYNVQDDYYNVGTLDNIIMSSSAWKDFDIETGGSPAKVREFFNSNRTPSFSKALEDGSVIHEWAEKQDQFKVADFDLPGEKIIEWVYFLFENKLPLNNENILLAKNTLGVYANYKNEDAIIKAFIDGGGENLYKYLEFGLTHHVISASTRDILNNVKESIQKHSLANKLILDNYEFESDVEIKTEEAIYFQYKDIPHKGKLDRYIIDHQSKTIVISDLKTLTINPYNYAPVHTLADIEDNVRSTSDSINYLFNNRYLFYSRKIYRQLFLYKTALGLSYPDYDIQVYVVACQRKDNFETVVWRVSNETLNLGKLDLDNQIALFNIAKENDFINHPYETHNGYLTVK